MGQARSRAKRKEPSEKQKPFFDKQSGASSAFFNGNRVQRKVSIGKSNDASEKEADSAARKVTQVQKAEKKEEEKPVQKAEKKEEEKPVQKADKKEEEKPVQKADKKEEEKPVQKAEKKEEEKPVQKAEKKEEEKPVQKAEKKEEEKPVQKAEKKEEDKPVQAKTDPRIQKAAMVEEGESQDTAKPTFENLLMKRKGMGFAMPDDLRKDMEGKFRTSFKDVRIHTDKEANQMCESIHALAFAHDYDIYFNEGMYNPEALSGRELLAHELAHIVQQNG